MRLGAIHRLKKQLIVTAVALTMAQSGCGGAPASTDVGATAHDFGGGGADAGVMPEAGVGADGGADLAAEDSGPPATKPKASAGQPRLATVNEARYLDGSGSAVPKGCTLSWSADPGVTLTGGSSKAPRASATKAGRYSVTVTVKCAGQTLTDRTALLVYDKPLASYPDQTFFYYEGAVAGDDTETGSQGRKYLFVPSQHPNVKGAVKEVWIDVKGQRLKMTQSGGSFYRWVPGAGSGEVHNYWAFVDKNRFARVPVLSTRLTPATASAGAQLQASVPLSAAFGGGSATYSLHPHPGNPAQVKVTAGGAGAFTIGAAKLSGTHRFYLVAQNAHYRSPPQLVTLPAPAKPAGLPKLGVIYEVYVKHFADSDGDGIGDLKGLTGKLSYLKNDLGIHTIQLMPIFKTPGTVSWGYAPGDFTKVHPDYGTMADLRALITKAHALKLKVLIDFPINHVHVSFKAAAAAKGQPSAPTSNWFHFFTNNTTWFGWDFRDTGSRSHFFARRTTGDIAFNLAQPDARAAVIKAVTRLLDLDGDGKTDDGADGFRLDYVKGPSRDFWRQLNAACRAVRPDVALVGEAWSGPKTLGIYLEEGGFNGVYDFPFHYAAKKALKKHDAGALYWHYTEAKQYYGSHGAPVPFVSNHDVSRVVASPKGADIGIAMAAASLTLTAPGNPQLQYGDELGMLSQTSTAMDAKNGGAFPWGGADPAQTKDPSGVKLTKPAELGKQLLNKYSVFGHHKALLAARKQLPALSDPGAFGYQYSEFTDKSTYAMVRQSGKSRALVVVNLGPTTKTVSFSELSKSTLVYRQGYGSGATLGSYGTHIYKLP